MSYVKEIEDYLNLRYAKLEKFNENYVSNINSEKYKKTKEEFDALQKEYKFSCNTIDTVKNATPITKIMLSNKEFLDAYSKNSNLLKQCEKYFPKEISSLNEEFKKINKGFTSENNVFERITRNVPKEWEILQNVNFAGCENDLVIITDTNIFTIEVKSYVATLIWNQVGNYTLQKDGKIVVGALDPYLQSVAHALAMSKKLKTDVIPLVLFDDGNNTVVKCENQEILNSLCSVSTLQTKITSLSSKKKIDKENVVSVLVSNEQKDKKFEFYNINEIIEQSKNRTIAEQKTSSLASEIEQKANKLNEITKLEVYKEELKKEGYFTENTPEYFTSGIDNGIWFDTKKQIQIIWTIIGVSWFYGVLKIIGSLFYDEITSFLSYLQGIQKTAMFIVCLICAIFCILLTSVVIKKINKADETSDNKEDAQIKTIFQNYQEKKEKLELWEAIKTSK